MELSSNFTNEDYADIFDYFAKNSNHNEIMINLLNDKIIPQLKERKNYLDIGAGPGHITKNIFHNFNETDILEPNDEYEHLYREIKYNRLIKSKFLDYDTKVNYDFILCSHVLYHVPHDDWKQFINKMLAI